MSEPRKKPGVAFWATVVVVVLAGYVIAYACTVRPSTVMVNGQIEMLPYYTDGLNHPNEPHLKRLFGPIHSVDRKVRPQRWAAIKPY